MEKAQSQVQAIKMENQHQNMIKTEILFQNQ